MPTKPLSDLRELVGESRVTVEGFRIEAGKAEEFARAVTDPNPVFRNEATARQRGHDRVPAPLTFTRVGTFPRYRPDGLNGHGFDLGFRPEYVLHGEQAYEYERPARVGDILMGTTTLTDLYQREGGRAGTMTFAVFETEYRDQDGDHVLTERGTSIETDGALEAEAETGESARNDTSTPREERGAVIDRDGDRGRRVPTRDGAPDRVHTASVLAVGDSSKVVVENVQRQDFVRYAGASGDFNPIHYDEPYARTAGNERVFGQGMFTAGITSRVVTDWFGIDAVSSFEVRFRSRAFPGDDLIATGEIVDIDVERDDGVAVTAELEATTRRGETLLTGTTTAVLPRGDD